VDDDGMSRTDDLRRWRAESDAVCARERDDRGIADEARRLERERADARLRKERGLADDALIEERWNRQRAQESLHDEERRAARFQEALAETRTALEALAADLERFAEGAADGDLGDHLLAHAATTLRGAETARRLAAVLREVEEEDAPPLAVRPAPACDLFAFARAT
jgi:hypothetical protein